MIRKKKSCSIPVMLPNMLLHHYIPPNHVEGGGGFVVDGEVTLDLVISAIWSEPTSLTSEGRVYLRTVSLKDGYKDMIEPLDQSKLGKIRLKTALRNRMYTHGSRIWFQVAKRIHSTRYLICKGPPDSTV